MKFPITRESLQAYDFEKEHKEDWINMQVALLLREICREFAQEMKNNFQEKKFVWGDLQHKLSLAHRQKELKFSMDDCLPRFIETIKKTFIGCDVYMDQLKTIIVIDWSFK